jgi:hypothetical protein
MLLLCTTLRIAWRRTGTQPSEAQEDGETSRRFV